MALFIYKNLNSEITRITIHNSQFYCEILNGMFVKWNINRHCAIVKRVAC